MSTRISFNKAVTLVAAVTLLWSTLLAVPQTRVEAPKNPYKIEQDVQLGRQAAAEVEQQLPLLYDRETESLVERVGRRLAVAIPPEFQYPQFRYSYKVVNARDINAFALPGGFTYVNRGLIEAAGNEGELAGVIAHEISHVALRHGTAQVAKAQKYSAGAAAGQILGAIIGGGLGSVIAQGSQFGIGAAFLRFSRSYEKQADTLGSHIMARAGYDPVDLANMFRTIERQGGGSGGPEWLSSHPNPGNRYEQIAREAQLLRVSNPVRDTPEFQRVRVRLRDLQRAPSMAEISRNPRSGRTSPAGGDPTIPRRAEPPSRTFETFRASDGSFQIGYPSNWQAHSQGGPSATIAPDWAIEGNEVTRGALINYYESRSQLSLNEAFNAIVQELLNTNQYLREEARSRYNGRLAGRSAVATFLSGRNNLGQNERVWLVARQAGQGVIYLVFIAPQNEFSQYESTFQSMVRSFALNDRFR